MSLSLSVKTVPFLSAFCLLKRLMFCDVKCLHEVHCRDPQFDTPLPAFLFKQSVSCKMIQRLV